MNEIERAAYAYLVKKYGSEGVTFRRKIPRFVTRDGLFWEPRRLYGNKILIYPQHVRPLFENAERTYILVIRDDRVVLEVPVAELGSRPTEYKGIEIRWLESFPRPTVWEIWSSGDIVALVLAFTIWRYIEDFDPEDWEKLETGQTLVEFVNRAVDGVRDFLSKLSEKKKRELGLALRKKMNLLRRVVEECKRVMLLS